MSGYAFDKHLRRKASSNSDQNSYKIYTEDTVLGSNTRYIDVIKHCILGFFELVLFNTSKTSGFQILQDTFWEMLEVKRKVSDEIVFFISKRNYRFDPV